MTGGLHFEKSINLGQAFIALSFVASAGVAFFAVRTDVEILKVHVATLTAADAAADKRSQQFRDEVVYELRAMNARLELIKERMDQDHAKYGGR
ncbi:MAG: hypothetical protein IT349_19220 [Candidatus Eisenbacteria bacterium]|nr:hypothetical protein [Candidatus Eisenbacteria bacterium]